MPPKYTSMGSTYYTIFRQEGIRKGLYGGVTPAFLGSFSGTCIFFGTYEWSKRKMIDNGIAPSLAYFSSGFVADLAASPLYVPSEVLKTRLQLQGRYNNPYFHSGYNYRGTMHALRTIVRTEGLAELFSGYKATLSRDLPFSALQFAFYEQEQKWAKSWVGSTNIGIGLEIFTGASAGGMAGVITCPLDVVKTRIQTQLDPSVIAFVKAGAKIRVRWLRRMPQHGSAILETESVIEGLKVIYRTEGVAGWFRGVGPRAVWTSVQSGTMLVMYQVLLKWFDAHPLVDQADLV
ncbi:hypothetical protein H2203_008581 [Taxawa tesnikishii (nom. ined.)]|nr:hypothetical protein H2203_008581 [Dothideales sp. JES 119]